MNRKFRTIYIFLFSLLAVFPLRANTSVGSRVVTHQESSRNLLKEKFILSRLGEAGINAEEMLMLTDSLMQLNPYNIEYQLKYASLATSQGEFERSEKVLEKALSRADKGDISMLCRIKWQEVQLNRMQGKIVNAVVDASDVLNIAKPDSMTFMDIEFSLFLADGYFNLGSLKLAEIYLDKAKKLFSAHKRSIPQSKQNDINCRIKSVEAQNYLYKGEKEKALNLVLEAMNYEVSPTDYAYLKLLTGAVYEELGEYDTALTTYKNLMDVPSPTWWNAMALPRYVKILSKTGRNSEIETIVSDYQKLAQMIRHTHRAVDMDFLRAMSKKEAGYDDEAWLQLVDVYNRLDRFAYYHAHGSRQADVIYDIMNVKQQEYQKELKKAHILIWIGLGLLLVTAIISLLLFRRIRQRKKEISRLQDSFSEKSDEIRERQSVFETRLNNHSHEMMSGALLISRLNDLLGSVKAKIDSAMDDHRKVSDLRTLLEKSDLGEDSDSMLKMQFSYTHGNLLDRLSRLHPSITNGEQKLIIYMTLGYSTKEIAEITFRSPRSVETMKYRLSKKILAADSTISLDEYLHTIELQSEIS